MENSPSPYYLQLNDTSIRAYTIYTIHVINQPRYGSESIVRSLRKQRDLPYPFTWYVAGNLAFVVNMIDLVNYESQQPTSIMQRKRQIHEYTRFKVIRFGNRDYHVESNNEQVVILRETRSGKNLQLMKYCQEDVEEDGEICVVCQLEFERDDAIGVLRCKHKYHPTCITRWLDRKNSCPVCRARAFK